MPPKCRRDVTPHYCTWRNFKFPHPRGPVGVREPLPILLTGPESPAHRTTLPGLFLPSQVMLISTRNDKTQILAHVCTREQPLRPTLTRHSQTQELWTNHYAAMLCQLTVPPYQFQALLTPTSRFFSTFAHATCLLSVSLWYLALREIYLAFNRAIPNSATLWHRNI